MAINTKRCGDCGENKLLEDFYNRQRSSDGKQSYCKTCHSARTSKTTRENPERQRGYEVKYLAENVEQVAEYRKAYYETNAEKIKRTSLDWKIANKSQASAQTAKHRALKVKAGGAYSGAEFEALKLVTGNVCLCCGISSDEVTLAADHVIPLSRGGANDISNIQPLCQSCNSSKGTRATDYRP